MEAADCGSVWVSGRRLLWPDVCSVSAEGRVRLVIATIAAAVAIAILIDSPRRELAAQLASDWQEYRQHVGNPAFSATSKNLQNSFEIRLDTKR